MILNNCLAAFIEMYSLLLSDEEKVGLLPRDCVEPDFHLLVKNSLLADLRYKLLKRNHAARATESH